MKKLILSVLALSMVAMVSAQDYSKTEVRDAKRTQRQEVMVKQLTNALKTHNFTFSASSMTSKFMGTDPILNHWSNYVSVYPGYMDVALPYVSFPENNMIPEIITIKTSMFTFGPNVVVGSQWTLVFQAESQNVKYVFHLHYNMDNGVAVLTLAPNAGHAMVYTGTIQPQ